MAGRAKKKPAWNGHAFKSMFSPQPKKIDADKNEANSSERKCVASKRKRDSCMDLHESSRCESRNEFETCVTCSKRRRFCDGKYCKTRCHPSSLDPSTDDVLVRVWHCFQCLNNKMQTGARPLSENVEAIWNTRETEVSDVEGLRKEKQYFVKYRGLSHIHNQWIPESHLSHDAEKLIEEFNKQTEVVKWNEEWVVPQRLLKKRLLLSPNQENNGPPGTSSCYYEWLVKWRGLDYESVTWELDTFLSSVHGANLVKDYENRHKKALDDPSSVDKDKNGSLVKLQQLTAGSPPGSDASNLETVNKLRDFTHKGQSAIVFDDKDRIMKMLLYIVSLSDICQPFLIVTTSSLLPVWEAEFLRAIPSVDIVVYNGSSDNRKCVRTLEFYDDDGRIMLHVLLSSMEIVVEDILFLDSIKWKALIVDECQQPKVSSQFERIKMLAADVKILLYSGALKDNVTEYLNLLSLLESCGDSINVDVLKAESVDSLCKLRERLSKYIACEGKSSSSKFVEFWVPSLISNVQLEQYCDTLLSNSISLCSYSKTDPVGALRDIVFSTRKSCDHPYIVDPSLKHVIVKDLPPTSFLDAEIKASGKLQLLEMILSEIKKQQLRVLILFQSVAGSGRDTLGLGDILDDFLREKYGADAYERLDGGVIPSKSRQAAMNNFNKGNGRFVFLLENRACLPSIKLVSVDTVIIFDSDWNPSNDVKALNRISIDSQFKQIKIFRLYSAFTVEEKVLILAKHGITLESNLESINRATSNTLLMWGASYLLDRLHEFHSTPDAKVSPEQALLSKVVDEISALISQSGECDDIDNSCILKIEQRGGIYSSTLRLLGEQQILLPDDEHRHEFWTKLLNRRILKWKYLSGKTQRHRKKLQHFDDVQNTECGAVQIGKKRKNGETNCINPSATSLFCQSSVPINISVKCTLPNAQTNIDLVKPDFLKLCEILKFSDEAKIMAERFLEYVISKHQVKSGSASILQAFLLALCWGSASLSKLKVNRKDSLFLARKHLKFSCSEMEADSVYSLTVRKLKKTFEENMLSDLSESSISGVKNFKEGTLENLSQLQIVKPELEEIRDQVHTDVSQDDESHKEDTENNFELIQRKCKKRIEKLKQKQEEEIRKMNDSWEVQRAEIESKLNVESSIYTAVYKQPLVKDKLKVLYNNWRKKLEELERRREESVEELKAKHLYALSNERSKVAKWLKSASFATEVACQDEMDLHRSDIQSEVGYSQATEHVSPNVSENDATLSRHPDDIASETNKGKMVPGSTSATDPNQDGGCNGLVVITESPNYNDDVAENMASKNVPVARSQQPNGLGSPGNGLKNTVFINLHHAENLNPDKILSSGSGEMILPETPEMIVGYSQASEHVSPNVSENDATLSRHPDDIASETNKGKMVPGSTSATDPNQDVGCNGLVVITESPNYNDDVAENMASKSVPVAIRQQPNGLGSPANGPKNTVSISLHHAENLNPDKITSSAPGEMILPETPETIVEEVTGQIVEENPLDDDQERHLADSQPEIPQRMVEHTEELPSQAQHLVPNVELHPPTDVIKTPLQQNQPDFPSISTLDHLPLISNTSLLNSEAAQVVIGGTTELPRQAVIPTGVDLSVVQGLQHLPLRAEHQVTSQILKLTPYSNPLQNERERLCKETEQAIKLYEDVKMRLKSEFEELMAELHRKYEDKCKDLDVVFQQKKNELDKNYNKVLMNEILADAFRSKCAEPSRCNGMQQGVHHGLVQPLNQLPLSAASRSSPIIVTSSAGKPAGSQLNTAPMSQHSSRVHPNNVTPTTCQPAASQKNTVLLLQHGTGLLPVIASSSGSQPAAKQERTTLLMQPESGINIISDSSSAGQPAVSQQNTTPLLHPSLRIPPIIVSSSAVQPAASQQSTPPLQIVQQSAALFSSTPILPPQISPITPSTGNLRVGSENRARAPAPHLQAFRSASSINLASTRVMPSHLTRSSQPTSSHPLPHSRPYPSPSKPPN